MIHAKLNHTYQTSISRSPHSIIADVATKLGGDDEGMNPHELLEGALAACTLMTMQMYGKRKGWDLTGAIVEVEVTKEEKESTTLRRLIKLPEELNSEAQNRLLEIADRCPIHRILTANVQINTELGSINPETQF